MAPLFLFIPFAYQIITFGRCLLSFSVSGWGSCRERYSFDSPGSIHGAAGDLLPVARLRHALGLALRARKLRKLAKDAREPSALTRNSYRGAHAEGRRILRSPGRETFQEGGNANFKGCFSESRLKVHIYRDGQCNLHARRKIELEVLH
jgi:hypothetical protein